MSNLPDALHIYALQAEVVSKILIHCAGLILTEQAASDDCSCWFRSPTQNVPSVSVALLANNPEPCGVQDPTRGLIQRVR